MIFFFLLAMFSKQRGAFLREPILYVFIAWILFQFGVYLWSADTFPELRDGHIREARIITYIFMFVVVAWWLGGSTKRAVAIISLCAIGYILKATFSNSGLLVELSEYREYSRLTLGYKNWEHASVYSAFIFLSLLIFKRRITSYVHEKFKWVAIALIYLALTYSVIAIIATKTRATWLGLLVSGAIFIIGYTLSKLKKYRSGSVESKSDFSSKNLLGFGIVLIIVIAAAISFNAHELIMKRVTQERDVVTKMLAGNNEEIPYSSIGIRINLWDKGIDWFIQRPFTGWGPQSRKALLTQSSLPTWVAEKYRHMHNSYIELIVSYGIIGLALFAFLFTYIWFRALQAWKAGYIPNDIMLFAGTWTIYWLIVNSFESYIIYSETGPYINAIVAGMLYSYHLKRHVNKC